MSLSSWSESVPLLSTNTILSSFKICSFSIKLESAQGAQASLVSEFSLVTIGFPLRRNHTIGEYIPAQTVISHLLMYLHTVCYAAFLGTIYLISAGAHTFHKSYKSKEMSHDQQWSPLCLFPLRLSLVLPLDKPFLIGKYGHRFCRSSPFSNHSEIPSNFFIARFFRLSGVLA